MHSRVVLRPPVPAFSISNGQPSVVMKVPNRVLTKPWVENRENAMSFVGVL